MSAFVTVENLDASAQFSNPYAASTGKFSYGFAVRTQSDENHVVFVTSDSKWVHYTRTVSGDTLVDQGTLVNFNTSFGGTNNLEVIVVDDKGWLFVNSEMISDLDMSGLRGAGGVSAITGVRDGDERDNAVTGVTAFRIKQPSRLTGPRSGSLTTKSGVISGTNVNAHVRNVFMSASVQAPYSASSGNWSLGFIIRRGTSSGIFAINDNRNWTVNYRPDALITEGTVVLDSGRSFDLNQTSGSSNTISILAVDNVGVIYLNDERLAYLDLTEMDGIGTASLITSFWSDGEPVGTVANYTDFVVWSVGE
jgi:hypothetical protein